MADFVEEVEEFLASFSPEEGAVSRHAFWAILDGRPATVTELADAVWLPEGVVARALGRLVERGIMVVEPETERVVGVRGLSWIETDHRLILEGRQFYAFCAVDAVGIASALKADARIESCCHHCRAPLAVEVRGGAVIDAPEGVVIWAVERDLNRSLRAYT